MSFTVLSNNEHLEKLWGPMMAAMVGEAQRTHPGPKTPNMGRGHTSIMTAWSHRSHLTGPLSATKGASRSYNGRRQEGRVSPRPSLQEVQPPAQMPSLLIPRPCEAHGTPHAGRHPCAMAQPSLGPRSS